MKRILRPLYDYLSQTDKITAQEMKKLQFEETILEAMTQKTDVHIITKDNAYTGKIIRYQTDQEKLVLDHAFEKLSKIIYLDEIKKISVLPTSFNTSQVS